MWKFHRIAGIIASGSIPYWLLDSSSSAMSLFHWHSQSIIFAETSVQTAFGHNLAVFSELPNFCSISEMVWNTNLQNRSTVIRQVTLIERVAMKTDYTANCPSAQARNKNISKLICGLMLPFNAVSNKSFIKLMATHNWCLFLSSSSVKNSSSTDLGRYVKEWVLCEENSHNCRCLSCW